MSLAKPPSLDALKPLTLYGDGGPNPTKVIVLLEALSLPYTTVAVSFDQVKAPSYTALNPNGRLPTLVDPNTNLTVWESGAIFTYLITTYDTSHKFSFPANTADAWHAQQWLYFQVSGHGPYYGQAFWFKRHHPETLPSAVDRYVNEAKRIMGVLDGWLAAQAPGADGNKWLVGGKCSYADVAFVSYQFGARSWFELPDGDVAKFPHLNTWLQNMLAIEAVTRALKKCEPYGSMLAEGAKF